MKKYLLSLAFILFFAGPLGLGRVEVAHAQIIGTYDAAYCANPGAGDKDPNAQVAPAAINNPQVNQTVTSFFGQIFTNGTIHYRLLCDTLITGVIPGQDTKTVSVYKVSQNLVNFAVLIILLVVAFSNILRIKLDTYAVKKAVPLLIFGVVMANLALPIIRSIVDFSGVLTATIIGQSSDIGTKTAFSKSLISAVYRGGTDLLGTTLNNISSGGSIVWGNILPIVGFASIAFTAMGPTFVFFFVGTLALLFIPAIMFFYLGLLFVARIYVLVILTAVSPIAFASLGYEPIKGKLWGWWWKQFINWTFMGPATFFLFWLAIRFYEAVGRNMDIGTYIVTLALVGFATQIPTKMGGTMMSQWSKAVAQPVRNALLSPFKSAQDYVKKAVPRDMSRFASSPPEWLAKRVPGGTLNYVRFGKELFGQLEAKNAQRESQSAAVRGGQFAGRFAASVGTMNAAKDSILGGSEFQKFRQSNLQTEEGRKAVLDLARSAVKDLVDVSSTNFNELDKEQREKVVGKIEALRDSGDAEKIQAAKLANAMIGRQLAETGSSEDKNTLAFYDKPIKEQGIDIKPLNRMYKELLSTKLGAPVADGDSGSVAQNHTAADEVVKKIMPVLNGQDDTKKVELLSSIEKNLGQQIKEIKNLEELEKRPTWLAYVKTLIEASAKNSQARKIVNELGLDRFRGGLGAPNIQFLLNNPSVQSQFALGDETKMIKMFRNGGLDEEALARLDPGDSEVILRLWKDNTLRHATREYFGDLIKTAVRDAIPLDQDRTERELTQRKLLEKLISQTDPAAAPKPIDEDELAHTLTTEIGLKNDIAIRAIIQNMRAYQSGAQTLQTVKAAHDAQAKAAGSTIKGNPATTTTT